MPLALGQLLLAHRLGLAWVATPWERWRLQLRTCVSGGLTAAREAALVAAGSGFCESWPQGLAGCGIYGLVRAHPGLDDGVDAGKDHA